MTTNRAAVIERLIGFLRHELKADGELTPETVLRERGFLNSIGVAKLLAFMRDSLGVEVPARKMVGGNFQTLGDIADLVLSVQSEASVS